MCWEVATNDELVLLNEIHPEKSDRDFGYPFARTDFIFRLENVVELHAFVRACYRKLLTSITKGSLEEIREEKCGYLKFNRCLVLPYVMVDNEIYLPRFFFDCQIDELKIREMVLKEWDVAYLKFCLRILNAPEKLFEDGLSVVIKLSDLKIYFTFDTISNFNVRRLFDITLLNPDSDIELGTQGQRSRFNFVMFAQFSGIVCRAFLARSVAATFPVTIIFFYIMKRYFRR